MNFHLIMQLSMLMMTDHRKLLRVSIFLQSLSSTEIQTKGIKGINLKFRIGDRFRRMGLRGIVSEHVEIKTLVTISMVFHKVFGAL